MTEVTRLLLVEDHVAFRESLVYLLEREPDLSVVGQAGSLAEARGAHGGRCGHRRPGATRWAWV